MQRRLWPAAYYPDCPSKWVAVSDGSVEVSDLPVDSPEGMHYKLWTIFAQMGPCVTVETQPSTKAAA
jgi:hypothetical protein